MFVLFKIKVVFFLIFVFVVAEVIFGANQAWIDQQIGLSQTNQYMFDPDTVTNMIHVDEQTQKTFGNKKLKSTIIKVYKKEKKTKRNKKSFLALLI